MNTILITPQLATELLVALDRHSLEYKELMQIAMNPPSLQLGINTIHWEQFEAMQMICIVSVFAITPGDFGTVYLINVGCTAEDGSGLVITRSLKDAASDWSVYAHQLVAENVV